MANEITIHCSMRFAKGGVEVNSNNGSFYSDVAGNDASVLTQAMTTSYVALDKGNLTIPGWTKFRNLSATEAEIIRIKGATGDTNPVLMLGAGEECLIKFDTSATAPVAKSDSGAPLLMYEMIEA